VIDKNLSGSAAVRLRVPGANGPGTVELLQAPSVHATSGVTIGGQSFGSETTTGQLSGAQRTTSIAPSGGSYTLRVHAASAALLTLPTH
jgi:Glycosyl hydrolase family 79 C-terminal beta domain